MFPDSEVRREGDNPWKVSHKRSKVSVSSLSVLCLWTAVEQRNLSSWHRSLTSPLAYLQTLWCRHVNHDGGKRRKDRTVVPLINPNPHISARRERSVGSQHFSLDDLTLKVATWSAPPPFPLSGQPMWGQWTVPAFCHPQHRRGRPGPASAAREILLVQEGKCSARRNHFCGN